MFILLFRIFLNFLLILVSLFSSTFPLHLIVIYMLGLLFLNLSFFDILISLKLTLSIVISLLFPNNILMPWASKELVYPTKLLFLKRAKPVVFSSFLL